MKVAFISGPYRADTIRGTVENIRRAEAVAIKYWKLGYAVICPHKNTALFDGTADDAVWLRGDLELLCRSDICVMLSEWEASEGSRREHLVAQQQGIEIVYE